jgi:hypothetical protein
MPLVIAPSPEVLIFSHGRAGRTLALCAHTIRRCVPAFGAGFLDGSRKVKIAAAVSVFRKDHFTRELGAACPLRDNALPVTIIPRGLMALIRLQRDGKELAIKL